MSAEPPRRSPGPLPNWAYYAALVLIFVAPSQLAYAVTKKDGPFLGYADVLAGLVCLAAFAAWLFGVGRGLRAAPDTGETPVPPGRSRLAWPPLAAWALVVVAALSISQAVQPKSAVIETIQWALYLVAVYMLFVNVLTDRRRLRVALLTLAASTTLVVLWSFYQYLAQPDPAQVSAGFTNRNTLSAFLALVLPLLVGGALHDGRPVKRLWWLVLAALGLVTMLSGPLIWVTVLALALVAFSARGAARWATLAVLAGFVLAMPWALPRNYEAAVTEQRDPYEKVVLHALFGQEGKSALVVKKRWLEWAPALRMLSANPVLGVGAGNYQVNIGQYYEGSQSGSLTGATLPNVKKSEPDTNNLYLVVAGSTGFCGLAALLGVFGHFWRRSRRLLPAPHDHLGRGLAAALPAAMVSLLVGNLFTAMFVRGLSLVIVLLFALAYAGAKLWREAESV